MLPFRKWTHLVVHHSDSLDHAEVDLDKIRKWHVDGRNWRDVGYHFVVERAGQQVHTLRGRPLDEMGSHCRGMNDKAIGVCLVGDFSEEPPTSGHLAEAASTIALLCYLFMIPLESVRPHSDYRPTQCPGKNFPWDELMALVEKETEELHDIPRSMPA